MTSLHAGGRAHPSERELRKFGWSTGLVLAGLIGLLLPWTFGATIRAWPFILAIALIVPAALLPRALRPVYRVWMLLADTIAAVNGRIILGLLFYVVFTPTACIRRLFGIDPLGLRPTDAASLRKPSRHRTPQSMERPF